MKKHLTILGAAIVALAAVLFWLVSLQPSTPDCLINCGFSATGDLYLTSMLPIMLGTLGIWLLAVGIRRK